MSGGNEEGEVGVGDGAVSLPRAFTLTHLQFPSKAELLGKYQRALASSRLSSQLYIKGSISAIAILRYKATWFKRRFRVHLLVFTSVSLQVGCSSDA